MEKYTVFMDWKNQYCQNGYTTQSKLQIQCNPYQITDDGFSKTQNKNSRNLYDPEQPKQS